MHLRSVPWRDALREAVFASAFFLPQARRLKMDRWLRGRDEHRRIRLADACVASFGKSGRTWLRVMVSRYYQLRFGLPEGEMLEFDNLHRLAPDVPKIFFTHTNYIRDYTGQWNERGVFYDKRVLLLVRDPRDILVSQYYQWKHRMRPGKKLLNNYPPPGADVSLWDFAQDPAVGLPGILAWHEVWERELPRCAGSLVVRYEDMRAAPEQALSEALTFFGTEPDPDRVQQAVAYAAFENMKKLEDDRVFRSSGSRMRAGRSGDEGSRKVRKAKVGGWRDEFTPAQAEALDETIRASRQPLFGYNPSAVEPAQHV